MLTDDGKTPEQEARDSMRALTIALVVLPLIYLALYLLVCS